MKNKSLKPSVNAHSSKQKTGMGDYYGIGVKQKVGRIVDNYSLSKPLSAKKLGKPPKSLA
jgi:hypothetical protein